MSSFCIELRQIRSICSRMNWPDTILEKTALCLKTCLNFVKFMLVGQ
ncbi:hypothetical protein Golax_025709 [Gossypium laxum]|uniref:Uncharacterized protein n=2 Tax=Gossypium TaxID=3633 RepID=A0A7J8X9S9_GOSAI|nr:hypothetical protein [Gossypium aridum]MBA0729796.1 hypothetical protein [Gossypium laxum]